MEDVFVSNWNSLVGKNHEVYHLGDFLFAPKNLVESEANRILERLNGKVHIIWGNHDKELIKSNNLNFASTHYLRTISLDRQKIVLCHYRMAEWDCKHHGAWHLWGHSHGNAGPNGPRDMDVGVDPLGYKPISFDELREVFTSKQG